MTINIEQESTFEVTYILKHLSKDFQVSESCIIPQHLEKLNDYSLYILKKSNFSTFDAIHLCAKFFNILEKNITYFGLKDKHAITQQVICIHPSLQVNNLTKFNKEHYFSEQSYLHLTFLQKAPYTLRIGKLLGNNFYITIRKLTKNIAKKIELNKKIEMSFINYYGIQRFSLTGCDIDTVKIGEYLIHQNFTNAFELIKKQHNCIGQMAVEYREGAESFFSSMDHRERNFLINSYYSFSWNQAVKQLLRKSNAPVIACKQGQVVYLFPQTKLPIQTKIISQERVPQIKIVAEQEEFLKQEFYRPLFVQTFFNIHDVLPDDVFESFYKASISFTLPSGAYATIAILQLIYYLNKGLTYGE